MYVATRMIVSAVADDATAQSFVSHALRDCWTWLPWAPLGWYFGFRAAWLILLAGVVGIFLSRGARFAGTIVAAAAAGLIILTILAADLTRAPPILLPLFFAGVLMLPTTLGTGAARAAVALVLAANLLTPAMHVSYTKVSLLSPLPIEVARLLRNAAAAP